MTMTAQELAQELWEAACYDADADLCVRILTRICQREHIALTEPEPDPYCVFCQTTNCGNNCDRAYERWAGK